MRSFRFGGVAATLLVLMTLLSGVSAAFAQDTQNLLPVNEAYKLTADSSTPGVIKLHWAIAQDYYLYRGRMNFKGGDGVTLGTAQLPDGEKHDDPYLGPVETYHHSVDATIPYTLAPGTATIALTVRYQGCHETDPKICYPPQTAHLDLPAPAAGPSNKLNDLLSARPQSLDNNGTPLPAEQAFQFSAIAQDAQHLLLRWTMPKGYYLYRDQTTLSVKDAPQLSLTPSWPAGTLHQDAHFGNTTVYFNEVDVPVSVHGDASGLKTLTLVASFQGCQDAGLCYPLMTRQANIDVVHGGTATGEPAQSPAPEMPPADAKASGMGTSLWYALLLALGGGLILNLMPCVLPVLSIKAIGLLESGENPERRRTHALMYTAGVLVSFIVLGSIIIALKTAWGAHLQSPLVVAVLALLMLAVALSMSGVVQFGASLGNTGSSLANRSGAAGDFFTGVLAVVVASPCTAPFMGTALAYAFVAPMLDALLVFVALGLGLALPFLAVGFIPAVSRLLPRPGRWMETLKEVLAFPMYLTAAWLAWVLAHQRDADAVGLLLIAAVLLAMTLWWFERSRGRGVFSRLLVVLLAAITLAPLYYLTTLPATAQVAREDGGTVAYSPEKLAELRKAGTPVFVDMTADWCVTCKANEHAVLDGETFQALLKRTGTVYMKGDWTDVNPTISAFLQEYHSPGVPLYVVFPKNGGPGKQLPTVLTSSLVEEALTEASK
ncbi:protein-disulfide reductase DsbD family protein [Dyella caseinilytica]|uniref:Protein-disulfide reductase DsbD n=1 Tax=Dyella caseinilytica TaxID=1849581 RepID=A0ABX7GWB3_9GAMM|nr:protein-disulfide reductase DsbD [Dyella caseinilytica]QRN54159.1 protein-disulfide reductase DsbD [Dyella caseinilytica]GFZ91993.1 cytochrome c biogenesis protein [Dyella caseinilytica]